jgi:hypothetical protein
MNIQKLDTSIAAGQEFSPRRAIIRSPFDSPVLADLAQVTTPRIAQMDVSWAAQVVAGYAYDAADLLSLLRILGIIDAPPWWRSA